MLAGAGGGGPEKEDNLATSEELRTEPATPEEGEGPTKLASTRTKACLVVNRITVLQAHKYKVFIEVHSFKNDHCHLRIHRVL
jgi:hypothetical protein